MSTTQPANGYQIRLEVLKMAKEMAEQEWHAKRDIATSHYHNQVEIAKNGPGTFDLPAMPTFDKFPSPDELKVKANELYGFITTK